RALFLGAQLRQRLLQLLVGLVPGRLARLGDLGLAQLAGARDDVLRLAARLVEDLLVALLGLGQLPLDAVGLLHAGADALGPLVEQTQDGCPLVPIPHSAFRTPHSAGGQDWAGCSPMVMVTSCAWPPRRMRAG